MFYLLELLRDPKLLIAPWWWVRDNRDFCAAAGIVTRY